MARPTTKRTETGRQTPSGRRSNKYVCPACGFKAAHAAGLGRHRSAIHGTVSKRQRMRRSSGRKTASRGRTTQDGQLAKRVSDLERRYDRLLGGLEQVLKRSKKG